METRLYPFLNVKQNPLRYMQNIFIELTRSNKRKLQYMEKCIRNARNMDILFIYVIEELAFQDETIQLLNLITLLKSDTLDSVNFYDEIWEIITAFYKKVGSGYSNNREPVPVRENNTTGNVPLYGPLYPDEHEESAYPLYFYSQCGPGELQ